MSIISVRDNKNKRWKRNKKRQKWNRNATQAIVKDKLFCCAFKLGFYKLISEVS